MEEKDNNESPSLDPKLAPLLLFGHDDATFQYYSVPTRALLPRRTDMDGTMRAHRWWTTAQGWLLMARRGSPCTFLWDPFTGRRIALPPDHDGTVLTEGCDRRCLLSRRRPTDPGCVVLVIDLDDTVLWYCHLGPGDQHWVEHHYLQPGTLHHEHRDHVGWAIGKLTAIDGKFYTEFTDHVAVLEFSPEPVFTVTAIDGDLRCPAAYTRITTKLVESNGDLHHVSFSHPIVCNRIVMRVSVYKLSVATEKQGSSWVKVDSLGGRAFFIRTGRLGVGASLDAQETGLKENCIYYGGTNKKVFFIYDMERGTTVVINPGANLLHDQSPEVLMPTR